MIASELHTDADVPEFLAASREFRDWLRDRSGFIGYEVVGAGRRWADCIEWRDFESALAGNTAFAGTEIAARFARVVQRHLAAMGPAADLA
ncbi:hypothetical protein [Nocardia sp. NPDC050710]|uniref:hypothetical protein n=1 Tax=Nocardia sp. NPDC050710 TaxID=3157220 RepID=UPI0033D60A80